MLKIRTQEEVKELIRSGISFQGFLDSKKKELISEFKTYRFEGKGIKERNYILVHLQDRKD